MSLGKSAVYYICNSEGRQGLVSRNVWNFLAGKDGTVAAEFLFQGREVLKRRDERGNEYYFVPTEVPVCLDYPKFLPEMNEHFGSFDIAGMVTWHEGGSAPPKVLTVHSIGDVITGVYGSTNPIYSRNLLLAMARGRAAGGLEGYEVMTEATHWSGSYVAGTPAELIRKFTVPMLDIEVGSVPNSWDNLDACRVLAEALLQVFDSDNARLRNILCLDGTHFEANFSQAVLTEWPEAQGGESFGVSHILANQWLVSGEYEKEHGLAYASAAVESIAGGIEAVAFHDKLKGCYKDLARALGEKYRVPILKHQRLRNPVDIRW